MKPVSFVEFCKGLRVELYPAQRVFAAVAYDGGNPSDFEGEDREIARRLFGDIDTIPDSARDIIVAVCGARAGKSYVLVALRLLHLALTVPLDTLAPGEVGSAIIVAPDLGLAAQALRFVTGAIDSSDALRRLKLGQKETSVTIEREHGRAVTIETLAATRGGSAIRGRSLVGAAMDESAFFRDDKSVVCDVEIYRALAPRVMVGGQLVVASTPWSEAGLLYDLFNENFGKPAAALVAHAPTTLLRPTEKMRAIVAREEARDLQNARREFHAEFMTAGSGLFFDPITVNAALELPTFEEGQMFAGADLAFRRDSAALAIVARNGDRFELCKLHEIKPERGAPLTPSKVCAEFALTMKKFGVRVIGLDGHYVESAREHFAAADIAIDEAPTGADGKASTYLDVRNDLADGRFRLLPEYPQLAQQLKGIQQKPLPGGGLQITSPRRGGTGHGDSVSALVLARWQAGTRFANYSGLGFEYEEDSRWAGWTGRGY